MLASSYATTNARFSAHNLGEKAHEISRVGQEVSVIPVIGNNGIVRIVQRPHHRHLTEFLPDAGMRGPGEGSLSEKIQEILFSGPDQAAEQVNARRIERQERFPVVVSNEWLGGGSVKRIL